MRRTLFVGNWKSTKNIKETEEYFGELTQYAPSWNHEVVLMPSYICLDTASKKLTGDVKLGAQDVSHMGTGILNGDIPVSDLKTLGVKYCLVGHVDRRGLGEENDRINKKMHNLINEGIIPILCIGETSQEYEQNRTREVLEKQLRECLVGVKNAEDIVIAYQPVWSIGAGHSVNNDFIALMADFVRKTVKDVTGNPMSANCTILYGGGPITNQTAKGFLEILNIDGLMATVASFKPQSWNEIVKTEFTIRRSSLE